MSASPFDLTGRTAFVTGASRGIGRVAAAAMARAGADVALVARGAEGLAETARLVEEQGRKAVVIPADVTSQEAVEAAVTEAIGQLGHIDIVMNNAGGSNFMVPFTDLRLSGWDKIMRLNVTSTVYVCHAVGRHLLERGSGSVINVASVGGLAGAPLISPYGAAKAAVISLTKTAAVELRGHGVRVNAVCPGFIGTELVLDRAPLFEKGLGIEDFGAVINQAQGRLGEVGDVAPLVAFLASDRARFSNGSTYVVDGGMSASLV